MIILEELELLYYYYKIHTYAYVHTHIKVKDCDIKKNFIQKMKYVGIYYCTMGYVILVAFGKEKHTIIYKCVMLFEK